MRDSHTTDPASFKTEEAEALAADAGDLADRVTAIDGSVDVADGDASDEALVDERISALQRELTAERDKHIRLAAEFDNFRKRMMKERQEAESKGQAELVRQIIDPLDDIARFAHVDPAATESATIVQGVEMVEKKLGKSLQAAGLEPVNPDGDKFNPSLHEAVGTEIAESAEMDMTVSRVYQVGYTFRGQLLRPARVVVRQYPGSH